jgi:hypothetical protein
MVYREWRYDDEEDVERSYAEDWSKQNGIHSKLDVERSKACSLDRIAYALERLANIAEVEHDEKRQAKRNNIGT